MLLKSGRRLAHGETTNGGVTRQEREFIGRLGLNDEEEEVIVRALTLANEVVVFLDRIKGKPTEEQRAPRRHLVPAKVGASNSRLESCPTPTQQAASEEVTDAVQRVLKELFPPS